MHGTYVYTYVYWTVHHCDSWRIKDQLDVTCYFISLLMCSTCFGHQYIHHQELVTILLNYHIGRIVLGSMCVVVSVWLGWPTQPHPSPLLVPWPRKCRAIPLLPLWTVRPAQSPSACTKVHFTLPFTVPYTPFSSLKTICIKVDWNLLWVIQAFSAVYMNCSLFLDVMDRRLLVANFWGQRVGPILKGKTVENCLTPEDGTETSSRNVGN